MKDGDKVAKTLNSSPKDALEGALNTWFNQYLETYPADIDHAKPLQQTDPQPWDMARWKAGLDSWSDYLNYLCATPPLDAPAGVMVERKSANSNTVSWFASYGAASYKLKRDRFPHWETGQM